MIVLLPPICFYCGLFLIAGSWRSQFNGYLLNAVIVFIFAALLRESSALYVLHLAAQTQTYLVRYFIARSAITVATAVPLLLIGIAYGLKLNRFAFNLSILASAGSALLTGHYEYERVAAYYQAYGPFYLPACIDMFAVAGTVAPLSLCIRIVRAGGIKRRSQRIQRAVSALHGDSDWLSIREAKRLLSKGGMIVGEADRPDLERGFGGRAPLLRYDGEIGSGHMLVFAGSGGYKTTATVIPSALEWRSGMVCLDPAVEVLPRVYHARRELGHDVIALNPERHDSDGFNVLNWIDPSCDSALLDIQAVVAWLCGESPDERYDDYFRHATRDLLACLLADIVFSSEIPARQKTLALLRRRVALPLPELRELLEAIHLKGDSYGFGFPAQLAGNLKDITEKQFSGFYGEAGNATSWLSVASLARLVCGDSFRTEDLRSGCLDVFINVPLKTLSSTPQVVRVILGSLLNSIYEARGVCGGRILFLLDEVARLGYMSVLETARDAGRKYGVNLCLLYQSLGQLRGAFGEAGERAWFDSAYLKLFAAIQDLETAEMLSRACGEFTALGDSFTQGTGYASGRDYRSRSTHQSSNQQQVARRLIKPEEILQRLGSDEQIVLIQNELPLRCGRAIYFRRPDMAGRTRLGKVRQLHHNA
jgi:type IV secretion system protein VirD4